MKKLILPIAAIAMAVLVGCGDDSSSSPSSSTKQETLPDVVKSFFDTDNYVCSETVNKCKTVRIEGLTELAQCNGSTWGMQMLEKPVAGCENATPETQTPSTENPPVDNPPVDNPPVDNPPVDNPPASGNMVSCDIPGVMGECLEFPAGSAEATAMEAQCVSVMMGTLGTGCAK